MAVATFDTLKFANTLKAAGVPPEHAEAQTRAFAELVQTNFKELATQEDIARLESNLDRVAKDLHAEIDRVAKAAKSDLDQVAKDIRRELEAAVERLERKIAEESQKLNARIDTFQAKHAGDMALMRWMLGAILTLLVGIAIRLFFYKAA